MPSNRAKVLSLKPYVRAWRSTICRSIYASILIGPGARLVTSYSSNIVAVPQAYLTAARVDGESPSLGHASYLRQSSAMRPLKGMLLSRRL